MSSGSASPQTTPVRGICDSFPPLGRSQSMIGNVAVLLVSAALAAPTPCASLKSISLPNTTITMAETVPPGVFTPPPAPAAPGAPPPEGGGQRGGQQPAPLTVPAFCRVAATLRP